MFYYAWPVRLAVIAARRASSVSLAVNLVCLYPQMFLEPPESVQVYSDSCWGSYVSQRLSRHRRAPAERDRFEDDVQRILGEERRLKVERQRMREVRHRLEVDLQRIRDADELQNA